MAELDRRNLGRGDQKIIGERRGRWLAIFVVAHPFVERVADAVRNCTDDLPVDNGRMDDPAGVVHEDDAGDLDVAVAISTSTSATAVPLP